MPTAANHNQCLCLPYPSLSHTRVLFTIQYTVLYAEYHCNHSLFFFSLPFSSSPPHSLIFILHLHSSSSLPFPFNSTLFILSPFTSSSFLYFTSSLSLSLCIPFVRSLYSPFHFVRPTTTPSPVHTYDYCYSPPATQLLCQLGHHRVSAKSTLSLLFFVCHNQQQNIKTNKKQETKEKGIQTKTYPTNGDLILRELSGANIQSTSVSTDGFVCCCRRIVAASPTSPNSRLILSPISWFLWHSSFFLLFFSSSLLSSGHWFWPVFYMAGVQLSSNNMTDFRMPMQSVPPRKPAPQIQHSYSYQAYDGGLHHPQQQLPHPYQQHQLAPHPAPTPSMVSNRNRMSAVPPAYMASPQYPASPASQHSMTAPMPYPPSRRMSTATSSTNSTGNHPVSATTDIRRSTSSRSANAQLGYVALMRRQKATVWCDRAQAEDPRLRAQKVADKKRAYLEVHGAGAGRTGTLGSGKHKHGGKTTDFSPSTLVGASVPVRLSANEVGDDADQDTHSDNGLLHRRTGSGRSSLGSSHRFPSGYQRPSTGSNNPSNVNTPDERADLPGVSEHPPAAEQPQQPQEEVKHDAASINSRGSEPEEYFGTVSDMTAPSAVLSAAERAKRAEELKRRGSVDDRTTSMSGVRLFVANPDDSD